MPPENKPVKTLRFPVLEIVVNVGFKKNNVNNIFHFDWYLRFLLGNIFILCRACRLFAIQGFKRKRKLEKIKPLGTAS